MSHAVFNIGKSKTFTSRSYELDLNPYTMTEEILRNRRNKKLRHLTLYQIYTAFSISFGAMCFGFVLGWSSPSMRIMLDTDENQNDQNMEYAAIAPLIPLGCCCGSLILSLVAHRNGPRKIMLLVAPLQFLIWILITMSEDMTLRFFLIFCCGFFSVIFELGGDYLLINYVAMEFFYVFSVLFRSSILLGVLLAYIFGFMHNLTHFYSGLSAFLVIIYFCLLLFCPESPVFLYDRNPDKARRIIKSLRGMNNMQDMKYIIKDAETRNVDINARYMLMSKVVFRAFMMILGLSFFQTFSGYYAFMVYNICVWTDQQDLDVFSKLSDAVILGVTYYISSVVSTVIHLRMLYGVRKPLIASSSLVTIILLALAAYFLAVDYKIKFFIEKQYIRLILQVLHIISYEVGYSVCPSIIIFDYLPTQVYHYIKPCITSFNWLLVYFMVSFTLKIGVRLSGSIAILILAAISFFGILYCGTIIIESKNKSLMQIQLEMGGNPVGSRSIFQSKYRHHTED